MTKYNSLCEICPLTDLCKYIELFEEKVNQLNSIGVGIEVKLSVENCSYKEKNIVM